MTWLIPRPRAVLHPESMLTEIHGHEVLHLLDAAQPPLTRVTLAREAARLWGGDARFHTCSSAAMSLDELIALLVKKGKVVETDGALTVNFARVCPSGQQTL